jgi:hypothetical protein
MSFRTWVVTYNVDTKEVIPHREAEWSLNLDSSATTPQKATVPSSDHDVTTMPALDPPFMEATYLDQEPTPIAAPGTPTKTFTK